MGYRRKEYAISLARYERERKEVKDPLHMGELDMLMASLHHPALSEQGRATTRARIDFLMTLLVQEEIRRAQDEAATQQDAG